MYPGVLVNYQIAGVLNSARIRLSLDLLNLAACVHSSKLRTIVNSLASLVTVKTYIYSDLTS